MTQPFEQQAQPVSPSMPIVLAALYKFVPLDDAPLLRPVYKEKMLALGIKGTILLAPEGINGTISGTREAVDAFLTFLKNDARFSDIEPKESYFDDHPFGRTKVKLKKELISLGEPANPNEHVGTYVEPQDWNDLISDPDVLLLDSRNEYETHLGLFKGAIDPDIRRFKELPGYIRQNLDPQKHKKIATFCTGGIRCEKLTSWLKKEGYEEVYHLKGGILKYLEDVPEAQSLWQGECYVFDERVGVGHKLEPNRDLQNCRACGHSLLPEDRQHPAFAEGESCPFCQ